MGQNDYPIIKHMKGPLFYAKILLFGEYGIIKDSKGLAIPYNTYQGALKKSEDLSEVTQKSNLNLNRNNYKQKSLTKSQNQAKVNLAPREISAIKKTSFQLINRKFKFGFNIRNA